MTNTFKCAACGGVFEKEWSDEEAAAEAHDLWGNLPASAMAVICDTCFSGGVDAALAEQRALGYPKTAAEAERARKLK